MAESSWLKTWLASGIADEEGFAESVAYCHPANAPLIAAAPALLFALQAIDKALSGVMEYEHAWLNSPSTPEVTPASLVRAAIAKATTL